MNTYFNKKWMAWLVLVLLVLNLSALGTIIYLMNSHQERHQEEPPHLSQPLGKAIVEGLSLDSAQAREFHELRKTFFREAKPNFMALRENRHDIMEELKKEVPDTLMLDRLTDTTGSIQSRLKKGSIRHYLRVRQLCNPEQQEKLLMLYRQMLMMEGPGQGSPAGMQYRRGWQQDSLNDRTGFHGKERMGRGRGMRPVSGNNQDSAALQE